MSVFHNRTGRLLRIEGWERKASSGLPWVLALTPDTRNQHEVGDIVVEMSRDTTDPGKPRKAGLQIPRVGL